MKYCSEELGLKEKQFSGVSEGKLAEILGVPISRKNIAEITDPRKVLLRRRTVGFPNPKLVEKACKERTRRIRRHEETLQAFHDKIVRSQERMHREAKALHLKSGSSGKVVKMTQSVSVRKSKETKRAAAEVKQ